MPQFTDLEQINSQLNVLGGEVTKTAEWGEKIETLQMIENIPLKITIPEAKDTQPTAEKPQSALSALLDTYDINTDTLDQIPGQDDEVVVGATKKRATPAAAQDSDLSTSLDIDPKDEQMLKQVLGLLPQSLKKDIEKIMSSATIPPSDVEVVIDALLHNRSVQTIDDIVRSIHARRKKRRTPHVLFADDGTIRPQWKRARFLAVVAASLLLLFCAWRFGYRPISSQLLLSRALQAVERNSFEQADTLFNRAQDQHRWRSHYFRIADAYRAVGEHDRVIKYYDDLLLQYPLNKKAALAYASYLVDQQEDYNGAIDILLVQFENDKYNRAILTLLGDTYLLLGDAGANARYDDARYYYAFVIDRFGFDEQIFSRMLRYFIRKDNAEQIDYIQEILIQDNTENIVLDALIELLEYRLQNNQIGEIEAILKKANLSENMNPQLHYFAADYFARIEDDAAAKESLNNALRLFQRKPPQTVKDIAIEILTLGRIARYNFRDRQYADSLMNYDNAIAKYEAHLATGVLQREANFGALYAGRGDVYYFGNSAFDPALENYDEALRNLYEDKRLNYRIGNINYVAAEYQAALQQFNIAYYTYTTPPQTFRDKNLLFAIANSLYNLQGFASAVGFYNEVIDILEAERQVISSIVPQRETKHREIIEMLIAAYNNAGVSYAQLHAIQTNSGYSQKSIAYFHAANELFSNYIPVSEANIILSDSLSAQNIATQLNQDGRTLRIYAQIPIDDREPFVDLITTLQS